MLYPRIFTVTFSGHLQYIIKLVAAIIQAGVFADFAYYYLKSYESYYADLSLVAISYSSLCREFNCCLRYLISKYLLRVVPRDALEVCRSTDTCQLSYREAIIGV